MFGITAMSQLSMLKSVAQMIDNGFASRILQRLQEGFDASVAVSTLNDATDGEIYVYGGVLRRVLFNDLLSGDLDVMVPNGDDRAFHTLNRLHVPFEFNRQGHHRYRWNNLAN
jgi:hypothetical protein